MLRNCLIILGAVGILALAHAQECAAKPKPRPKQEAVWTLQDTINHSLSHSPAMKRDQEAVNMARENVRQAKAGHYPKVDVEASGGASTLPVSRYD